MKFTQWFTFTFLILAVPSSLHAGPWIAMTWIDGVDQMTTPAWQRQLNVTWNRVSCRIKGRETPTQCVNFVRDSSTPGITKHFLYVNNNSKTLTSDAARYSSLTASVPAIESVGFDDFFSFYEPLYGRTGSSAISFLNQFIDNLKASNPRLKFGVTVYENDLDTRKNQYINERHLPASLKAKFDYVHLFLHYRKNASQYAEYVEQAREHFPNARIIAGVYSCDRIDYLPCAEGNTSRCSSEQEIDEFQEALNIQIRLLREGKVLALEFFPGYFGDETNLYGTGKKSTQLACRNVARCVQNTYVMRDRILAAYRRYGATPTAMPDSGIRPTISEEPTFSRLSPGDSQIFRVRASGSEPIYYQWKRNGVAISGATQASYHTPRAVFSDNNSRYECLVSNRFGSTSTRIVTMIVEGLSPRTNASVRSPEFAGEQALATVSELSQVRVYPNPWRINLHNGTPMTFDQIPPNSTVKIFTVSAHWVQTLSSPTNEVRWDLTNSSGERVASGIYLYLVTTSGGDHARGKFAIIR